MMRHRRVRVDHRYKPGVHHTDSGKPLLVAMRGIGYNIQVRVVEHTGGRSEADSVHRFLQLDACFGIIAIKPELVIFWLMNS